MPISSPHIYIATRNDSDLVSTETSFIDKFKKHNIDSGRAYSVGAPADADIIVVFQNWSFKLPAYAKEVSKDPFVMEHAKKIYVINYDDVVGEGFFPGCYVSLQQSVYDHSRFRPCAYPKIYNELINAQQMKAPIDYLYSFRGTLHSHPIRQVMYDVLKEAKDACVVDNTKAFHTHTPADKLAYVDELTRSHFVLCPRGHSPNSYRLYETMSLGRCPVIISDEWTETPGPDWSKCSIRIAERDVVDIDEILRYRKKEAVELGNKALEYWNTYFKEEATYNSYLDQLVSLHQNESPVTKSLEGYQSHWRSRAFLKNNDWALDQKIMRRLLGLIHRE